VRLVCGNLIDFFLFNQPQAFAYVRVLDTNLQTYTQEYDVGTLKGQIYEFEAQTSVLEVIDVLWQNESVPQTISLVQSVHRGNEGFCDFGVTNLLRKGGVYLLPIKRSEWFTGTWEVNGDTEVLYEVDDNGKIWSHSPNQHFNQYDGQNSDVVANYIIDFTSDENFTIAVSKFGWAASNITLAEVTVTSVSETVSAWGDPYYNYVLDAEVLSAGKNYVPQNGIIPAVSMFFSPPLVQGERYLLFLEKYGEYEPAPSVDISHAAKINSNGTLTPYADIVNKSSREQFMSVFSGLEDCTVAELTELAEKAKSWHEKYPSSFYNKVFQ
jgi:hypothetical protein